LQGALGETGWEATSLYQLLSRAGLILVEYAFDILIDFPGKGFFLLGRIFFLFDGPTVGLQHDFKVLV
jgi:hypothetical protein